MTAAHEVETDWTGMVAGIGASAGGVSALRTFFKALPAQTDLAFVVILHSQAGQRSRLSEVLQACTPLHVCEAVDGMMPARNRVYVARSDQSLTLVQGRFRTQSVARSPTRPGIDTVDTFLESLAADRGDRAIGVVLSGMSNDGAAGAMHVKRHGGTVFVQDPATAEHDSMPRAAIVSGAVDYVLPVEHIAQVIGDCGSGAYVSPPSNDSLLEERYALDSIFALVRDKAGFNLSGYKVTPLVWRIQHRLQVAGLTTMAEYAALLQRDAAEIESLLRDIPIHVTQFFRDPDAWDALETQVVDRLFHDRGRTPVRVWSAACASGEEAYSIAMLLAERASRSESPADFRVFATDASPHILAHASRGIFPQRTMGEITSERQARFFRERRDGQQVRRALRRKLVFALQDLITDSPFRHLDLVICRNLLIYLDPQAARRVVYLLHSALRTGGYLFLGASESLPLDYSGFEPVSARFRIFRKVGPIIGVNVSFPKRVTRLRAVPAPATAEAASHTEDGRARRDLGDELRTSHEELDASREELQAVNEELLATNEQLNVSNEELNALNAQLRGKIGELQTQTSVLSSAGIMTLFLDEQLCVQWFTTAMSMLFPLVPGDVGRRITDLSPLFDDPHFIRDVRDTVRTDTVRDAEVRSAEGRWYSRRSLPFHGGSDTRKGVAVTFDDITARKNAEDALTSSRERLRQALETDAVGVLFSSKQGVLVDANEIFLKMSGWSREDIASGTLDWRRMTPPEYVPESEAQMEMLLRTGRIGPYEKEYLRKDGSRAWMMFAGRDLGDGTIVEYAIDISDRKLAERALRENEQRFRAFVMAGADIVYRMNADWSEMWQLKGAGRIPDLPEPTANWLDVYIHPDDRTQVLQAVRTAMETRRIFDALYRVRRIDGSFGRTHSRAVPIIDERGQIVEWLGTASDVAAP